jgi:hypothetical protein
MCCLLRAIAYLGGGGRWVWNNGGKTVSRGISKKLREKPILVPFHPPQLLQEFTRE